MSILNDTDLFIAKAKEKHGNTFDYSETVYVNRSTILSIICPIHGKFDQIPYNHLKSATGCPKCSLGDIVDNIDTFLEKAVVVHNGKYDYTNTVYSGQNKNVKIICPIHGEFSKRAREHLKGDGCVKCRPKINHRKIGVEDFIRRSNIVHKNKYDYSKSVFNETRDNVVIICPIHGEFTQQVTRHMTLGRGCSKCAIDSNVLSQDQVILEFNEIHGDRYDYSKVLYVSNISKVEIICKIHGNFRQTPKMHKNGQGCPKCGVISSTNFHRDNVESFIVKANKVHNNKYDYSKVIYADSKTKIDIICENGHKFSQIPNTHIGGHGCPECAGLFSKPEKEVLEFIKSIYSGNILASDRATIYPYELDIFLPDLKLAIEFNGLYWHSEASKHKKYHSDKWKNCSSKGVRLVQIWEDEWRDKRELCESFLRSIILPSIKLYARKLFVKPVPVDEQRSFLSQYHFQGYVGATKCLGLYSADNVLIQLMSLKRLDSQGNYEIGRLCTKSGYSVVGGSERLFKNLLQDLEFSSIISFNNLDKFTGEVYDRLGMKLEEEHILSYHYTDTNNVFSRQQFQKHKLIAQGHDPNLTEHQIANSLGFYRIYPTGNSKYSLKP